MGPTEGVIDALQTVRENQVFDVVEVNRTPFASTQGISNKSNNVNIPEVGVDSNRVSLDGSPDEVKSGSEETLSGDVGFRPLIKRWSLSGDVTGCFGGGIPTSASEDNMLALVTLHETAREIEAMPQTPVESKSKMAAPGLADARRVEFILRLHRASMLENVCQSVVHHLQRQLMDGSHGVSSTIRERFSSSLLKAVKAHFNSFPSRYAHSVEPEDVAGHMRLLANSHASGGGVEVDIGPMQKCIRRQGLGLQQVRKEGQGEWKNVTRGWITVACRDMPGLLDAITRSVGLATGGD
ncbi:unnamed protein product [Choristocarpus tenellus]